MPTGTTYKFGFLPGQGANREDLRGHKMPRKRAKPAERGAARLLEMDAPIDTSGVDPAMARTIQGERARRVKAKAVFNPGSLSVEDQIRRKKAQVAAIRKSRGY